MKAGSDEERAVLIAFATGIAFLVLPQVLLLFLNTPAVVLVSVLMLLAFTAAMSHVPTLDRDWDLP